MDKNQQDNQNQQTDSMSSEKNNEDYKKQRPNPNDPNQTKNNQRVVDEEMENINREITAKTSGGPTSNAWNQNHDEDDVDQGAYNNDNQNTDS